MSSQLSGRDRTAFRLAFVVPWVALAITALAVLVVGAPTRQYQLLPFAASIVLFGLPHGAVDHLTLPWAYAESPTWRWVGFVGGLYLVVGVAYASVWFLAPVAGFGLFILITWFHWGQGDLQPLLELTGPTHLQSRPARLLTITARGSLPMALPLVAFPGEYRWVAQQLVSLFGVDIALLDPVFSPTARVAVAAGIATLLVAAAIVGYREGGEGKSRYAWRVDIGEICLLTVFFVVVPPILAIGIFFCWWHAIRHVTRLALLDETTASYLDAGDVGSALARFGRQATPMSVGALAIFGGLALAVPVAPVDAVDLFAVYLVGIAVVTAPHVIIVTWLDVESGFWSAAVDRVG